MFQFRRFPTYAYLIQRTLTEYCSAGFPHSEILGYNAYVQLPQAYRSLSRPSSAPDAKAFPLRSYQLDLSTIYDRLVLRIMQASDSVHCSFVLPFKSPQKFTLLPLCCLLQSLDCFTVQFSRCRSPTLFKVRLKCSGDCLNTSIQSCGGGYRTRTGDPLLAKQVFYQLN